MPNFIPEFSGYSGQGKFRYWCQTVLPLIYDDSLSYYELLNKMVVYLNNTIEDVAKAEGNIDSLLTAYTQLQGFVNDYFDNLDVQEEINNKLDEMAESGELSDLLEPFIPDLVTAWLNEHITPTTPIVDNTLSITGAAADAKVTGDEIAKAIKSLTYISHDDLKGYTTANDFPNNSVIGVGYNVLDTDIANLPLYGVLSYVITTSYAPNASSKCQLYLGVTYFAIRVKTANTWGSWKVSANNEDALKYALQDLSNYTSLAELPVNIVTLANNTQGFTDFPEDTSSGVVFNMQYNSNYMVQFFICFQSGKIRIWWRIIDKRDNSAYTSWIGLANLDEITSLTENKADKTEILRYSAYDLSSYPSMASTPINEIRSFSRDNVSWSDIPDGVVSGSLYNLRVSPAQKMQFLFTYQGTYNIWYRIVGLNDPFTPLTEWHKMLAPEDLGTSEEFAKAIKSLTYISHDDLKGYTTANDFPNNSVIGIGSNVLETDIANLPAYGELSYMITTTYASNATSKCQLYIGVTRFAFRVRTSGTWGSWKISANNATALKYELQTLSNYTSLAELPVNIVTLANKPSDTSIYTDFPADTSSGVVFNMQYNPNYMVQFFICFQSGKIRIWWRIIDKRDNSAYTSWIGLANLDEITSLTENKADKTEILRYSAYDLSSYPSMASTPINEIRSFSRDNVSWSDIPDGVVSGSLYNLRVSPAQKMQFLFTYQGTYNIWYRIVGLNDPFTPLTEWHKILAPEDLGTLENNSIKYISSLPTYINDNNFNSLSDIIENIIGVYNKSSTFDMPDSAFSNFIFMNMRYAANYNIQFAFTVGGKQFKYRIVDRRNGNIYTDWNAPDSFDGKVCLAMGDSICVGSRNSNYGFIGYFYLDLTKLSRVGACISNIRVTEDTSTETYCIYKQFENYANNLEHFDYYPDILIADGGINDYVYHSPLGTEPTSPVTTDTDANNLDKGTISGGLQYLFYLWIKNYPKAQKYFLLTHKTYFTSSGTYAPTHTIDIPNGYNQTQMNDMIKKICNVYGVEVIDVFGKSMINTKLAQYVSPVDYDLNTNTATDKANISNSYFVDSDGIHPMALGYRVGYVPFVREALKTSTKKELLDDYLYFEFDGSEDEDWRVLNTSPTGQYTMLCYNADIPNYIQYGYEGTPTEAMNIIKSNQFPEAWSKGENDNFHPYYRHESIALANTSTGHYIRLYSEDYQLVDAWRTHLMENPLKVIIKKPVYTTV